MEVETSTVLAFLGLAGGGATFVGAWVISVEKRLSGFARLQRSVDDMGKTLKTVDRRTERLSMFIASRDVAEGEPT